MNESDAYEFVEDDPGDYDFVEDDFTEEKPERGLLEKGARIAGQYALGRIEGSTPGIVYDIGVAPAASKGYLANLSLEDAGKEIEGLYEKNVDKSFEEWDPKDKEIYEDLSDRIKNPSKVYEEQRPNDLSIRNIAQKITGVDLTPEGTLEKAAQWSGFVKDSKGFQGKGLKDIAKGIAPTGTDILRGLGAGTMLQLAEQNAFGPMGKISAAIIGDFGGGLIKSSAKGIYKAITNPKETLAEIAKMFTSKDKIALQQSVIKDFRDANIQADLGTLTDSDLIKFVQTRLAQSGLTGKALDDLKTTMTNDIKSEYKGVADSLGQAKFDTLHEAGEVAKKGIEKIRDTDLAESRALYRQASNELPQTAFVNPKNLLKEVNNVESKLKPGSLKSTEQKAVLDILQTVKRDITDSSGKMIYGKVQDLINNKIALNDIINYEVQGGTKQLLKGIVGELDRAIISYGKQNPKFGRSYISANQKFSNHSKTFRNKNATQLLSNQDPAQLLNKMSSVQGIRDMKNILGKTNEGREIFNGLKRLKLDETIGKNMVDSTTQQLKNATFSKLLEKGRNREIFKEILDPQAFKRLTRLQKNAGRLAESAQKFLNTSKSGVTLEDAAIVSKVMLDVMDLLSGNPWGLIKTGVGVTGGRYLTKLMGDPQFLNLVEEMILATNTNNPTLMAEIGNKLAESIKTALVEENANRGQEPKSNK